MNIAAQGSLSESWSLQCRSGVWDFHCRQTWRTSTIQHCADSKECHWIKSFQHQWLRRLDSKVSCTAKSSVLFLQCHQLETPENRIVLRWGCLRIQSSALKTIRRFTNFYLFLFRDSLKSECCRIKIE
jgi:hypothetical protein